MQSVIAQIDAFEGLRQYIDQECGIYVSKDKSYLFESRLMSLMGENGCVTSSELHAKAKADATGLLKESIIDALTTNETLWFRDTRPWTVIEEVIYQTMLEQLRSKQKDTVKIWSAGCSTGQEPYSLAMLIDKLKQGDVPPEKFRITATDISPSVLYLAMSGKYNQITMSRGLGDEYKDRYFEKKGSIWEIKDEIKNRIKFDKLNLQNSFSHLGGLDFIMCRNVAIYFRDAVKENLFNRFADALNPNGYLIIGASETIPANCTKLKMKLHKGIIYYQKTEAKS